MDINIVTGFPGFFDSPLTVSMLGKAVDRGVCRYHRYDLREYTLDRHQQIDDEPYAGKPGMVLKPEPFFRAMDHIQALHEPHPVIYCGPEGERLTQSLARELATEQTLTFLCGHFKGIDHRVIDTYVTRRISIGDFIITGGELATLVVLDATVRLLPGVMNNAESADSDSFEDGMLDCDYYTRPAEYRGQRVPDVLNSGDHARIQEWKRQNKKEKTDRFRPDLTTDTDNSNRN